MSTKINHAGDGSKVEIIRDGVNVHFIVSCKSDYDAILLYDRLGEEMRCGYLKFEIHTKPKAEAGR
jgi:hypothetical protein